MSSMKSIKKIVGYKSNMPRCETCISYKKPIVVLTNNSNTKRTHHYCLLHNFSIAPLAVCNTWTTKD